MINLELTYQERLEFQNILPIRASLDDIRLAKCIIDKVKIDDIKEVKDNNIRAFEFEESEIGLMRKMIDYLIAHEQVPFTSLSLIEKILSIKETE